MNSIWLTKGQKTFKASQRQSMYVNDQFSYGSLSNIYMHASFIKKHQSTGQHILHQSRLLHPSIQDNVFYIEADVN